MAASIGFHTSLAMSDVPKAPDLMPAARAPSGPSKAPSDPCARPFGPNAPWNVPVAGLSRHSRTNVYAERLWEDGSKTAGNINLSFDEYTYPVYHTDQANGQYPVRINWNSPLEGKVIPWHPNWRPAKGTDAQVIILDPDTGREWDLWQVKFDGRTVRATNGNLVPGNYWTREVGFKPSRGAGIPYLAMLVRPYEIECGEIPHALSMAIRNTDGDSYVAPATKLEHPDHGPGVPEGMRFALDVSDADIEAWLAELPEEVPEATRQSARIIGRALRDYGWFITDTAGSAHLQFEYRGTAGDQWERLGLGHLEVDDFHVYPRDLLDGLLKKERIYAIVPSDDYPPSLRARKGREFE
jgi:hypothetical protein